MAARRCLIFLVLMLGLLATSAQAAQLFPLKTGIWMEMDRQDNLGNKWTVRIDALEEVTLDGKQYFHVRQQNYDPLEEIVLEDFYLRSTDTEAYRYNGPGLGETLVLRTGPVGTSRTIDGGAKKINNAWGKIFLIVAAPWTSTFTMASRPPANACFTGPAGTP